MGVAANHLPNMEVKGWITTSRVISFSISVVFLVRNSMEGWVNASEAQTVAVPHLSGAAFYNESFIGCWD